MPLLGDAVGGHGVPGVGFIPELLALPLLGLLLPGVVELEVELPAVDPEALLVPGSGPHGPPLGDVAFGVVEGVLPAGLVVEGLLPGFVVPGVVDPGVGLLGMALGVVLGVELGIPGVWLCGVLCGVAVPAGGVAVLAGGVAVPGVAVEPGVVVPGVVLCPALPVELLELPGDVPPAGALCATAQLPQHRITESNISLLVDICMPPTSVMVNFYR